MKTNIVIPMIDGPDDCTELRMALRTIEKNISGDLLIWIYGHAPPWIRNVKVMKVNREHYKIYTKFRDLRRKIEMAANNDGIGPRFIYTYDDIYFLKPTSLDELRRPIAKCDAAHGDGWHKGTGASRNWISCMRNTLDMLHKKNLPMYSYETHLPRVFNREKVKLLEPYPESGEAVQFATWYYNHYVTDPVLVDDIKYWKLISGVDVPITVLKEKMKTHYILNANKYRRDVIGLLRKMFPEKSRYEV